MRLIGQAHTLVHQNGVVRIQSDIRVGTRYVPRFPYPYPTPHSFPELLSSSPSPSPSPSSCPPIKSPSQGSLNPSPYLPILSYNPSPPYTPTLTTLTQKQNRQIPNLRPKSLKSKLHPCLRQRPLLFHTNSHHLRRSTHKRPNTPGRRRQFRKTRHRSYAASSSSSSRRARTGNRTRTAEGDLGQYVEVDS
jgi:hypothetical protein